jgi:hypothetical protein
MEVHHDQHQTFQERQVAGKEDWGLMIDELIIRGFW